MHWRFSLLSMHPPLHPLLPSHFALHSWTSRSIILVKGRLSLVSSTSETGLAGITSSHFYPAAPLLTTTTTTTTINPLVHCSSSSSSPPPPFFGPFAWANGDPIHVCAVLNCMLYSIHILYITPYKTTPYSLILLNLRSKRFRVWRPTKLRILKRKRDEYVESVDVNKKKLAQKKKITKRRKK